MKQELHSSTLSRRNFLRDLGYLTGGGIAASWMPARCLGALGAQEARPRVVSIHNDGATHWDYVTDYYWQYVDQQAVNGMVNRGVRALTGAATVADAWRALIPYQAGDSVLLKLNFNNSSSCGSYNNSMNPLPETVNAVADGLIGIGIPAEKIWIADPSRIASDRFRSGIANTSIQYYGYQACNDPNYHQVDYVAPDSPAASIATNPAGEKILPSQVLVDADHLINIPLLKSHGSYVTLALKNHYGSVLFENYDRGGMHAFFNAGGYSGPLDLNEANILADINNNPHIKDKTRLVVGDGLFGNPVAHWTDPRRWQIFGDDDPNMLFFSTDPVAISSVMTDYIVAERGTQRHEQLHAAVQLGLGVHDHWDSVESQTYSLIDYMPIDMNGARAERLNIERQIRQFKDGSVTEADVKALIDAYMTGE